jgi:hypothetical protein
MEGLGAFAAQARNEHIERFTKKLLERRRHGLGRGGSEVDNDYGSSEPDLPAHCADRFALSDVFIRIHKGNLSRALQDYLAFTLIHFANELFPYVVGAGRSADEDQLDLVIAFGTKGRYEALTWAGNDPEFAGQDYLDLSVRKFDRLLRLAKRARQGDQDNEQ